MLVKDDELQAKKALNFIVREKQVFVSMIVLCKTIWVLERCYEVKKKEMTSILKNILSAEQFIIENSEIAWKALFLYTKKHTDFADFIISCLAELYDCDATVSFDKKAIRSNAFERL